MPYLKFVKLIAKRKSGGCRAPWYRRRTCPDILRRSYSAQSGSGRCTRVASTIAMMPDISPIVACLIAVVSDSIALRHGDDFGFSAESLGGFD